MSGKFDMRVHLRDPKTGVVMSKQPYKMVIQGGQHYFVRNGVRYHADGTQVNPDEKEVIPKTAAQVEQEMREKAALFDAENKKLDAQKAALASDLSEVAKLRKQLEEQLAAASAKAGDAELKNLASIEKEKDAPRASAAKNSVKVGF